MSTGDRGACHLAFRNVEASSGRWFEPSRAHHQGRCKRHPFDRRASPDRAPYWPLSHSLSRSVGWSRQSVRGQIAPRLRPRACSTVVPEADQVSGLLPSRRCRRLSAMALSATSRLEPDMEIAATSRRRVKRSGSKTPAADREREAVVADRPGEVLPHLAIGLAGDLDCRRDVEWVGAHQDHVTGLDRKVGRSRCLHQHGLARARC